MSKLIRIDADIYESLKKLADPFEDTPNTVIRKLLAHDLSSITGGIKIPPRNPETGRIKKGKATPQPVYEEWLMYILWKEFQGKARKKEITSAVISNMQKFGVLKEVDFVKVSTGETRAENTIAWGRNRLKEEGFIVSNSPAGIWELTEKGIIKAKNIMPTKSQSEDDIEKIESSRVTTQNPAGHVFEYMVHNARAKMIITESNLYSILKGSTALKEEKMSIPENAKRTRENLILSGILVTNLRGLLEFTKNVEFKSPSAASAVISGSSTDGWICFKDRNGKTLKHYRKK